MIDAFFAVEFLLRSGEIPNAGRLRHEPDLPQVANVAVVEYASLIDSRRARFLEQVSMRPLLDGMPGTNEVRRSREHL